jgi:hypothetical protein
MPKLASKYAIKLKDEGINRNNDDTRKLTQHIADL